MHVSRLIVVGLALCSVGALAATSKGSPTAIVDPNGALKRYFKALSRAEAGQGVARALHYGDSTLGADGLATTVRKRLSTRFGDAGPGFVSGGVDDVRVSRADVELKRAGTWRTRSILKGGAEGRYGLGGAVGIASAGANQKLVPPSGALPWKKAELWYQAGVGYGSLWAKADDRALVTTSAVAASTEDHRLTFDVPEGFSTLSVGATDGPVPWYGVVLETGNPGITWETQSVIGVGSKSFRAFSPEHLGSQLSARAPDLVVLQIGGNEAGFPVLQYGDGSAYLPIFRGALDLLRAGAPDAACLVVSPLDQGERVLPEGAEIQAGPVEEEGEVAVEGAPTEAPLGEPRAKASLPRMVAAQRRGAAEAGCAFWSAFDAMGGSGSILTWSQSRPALAWSDLLHLSPAGLGLIGDRMADALLSSYDAWKLAEGQAVPAK